MTVHSYIHTYIDCIQQIYIYIYIHTYIHIYIHTLIAFNIYIIHTCIYSYMHSCSNKSCLVHEGLKAIEQTNVNISFFIANEKMSCLPCYGDVYHCEGLNGCNNVARRQQMVGNPRHVAASA